MLLSDTTMGEAGFVISAIRILGVRADIVTAYVLPCICIADVPTMPSMAE